MEVREIRTNTISCRIAQYHDGKFSGGEELRFELPGDGWFIVASSPEEIWIYWGNGTFHLHRLSGGALRVLRSQESKDLINLAPAAFRQRLPARLGGAAPST